MSQFVESIESRRLFATTLPTGFTETLLPGTVSQPTSTVQLPDGRLLVSQKNGQLRVFKNGGLLGTPAMALAVDSSGERGLLGVEADPKFASNHYIYVSYFRPNKGYGQVSRFTMDGDTVKAGSELILIGLSPQTNPAHCAGAIHFGKDGKLYISVGDNEDGDNSQSFANLHGKILRINPDGGIPQSNPFYNTLSGKLKAIYAIGVRNAFTFASDPVSGAIFFNDVGAKAFEEINKLKAGGNFGWPGAEGNSDNPDYTDPVYAYAPPAVGVSTAITGGAFYDGVTQQFPDSYEGQYFFGDYAQGFVKTLDPITKTASPFASGMGKVLDLDVGSDGTLFVTTYDGRIHAITYKKGTTPPPPPPPGTATYSGYVVNDLNGDGKWTSGEEGIGGRTVWIDLDNDGQLDSDETRTTTAANGKFTFTGLAAGNYKIREVIPTGWSQTYPTNNFGLNATLTAGQVKSGASFQVTKV